MMKKQLQKTDKKFPFMNRFLSGLVITLALTLTAFEWTTVTTEPIIDNTSPRSNDIEEMLPPITYRPEEAKKVLPKKSSDQMTIVDVIKPATLAPSPKKNEPSTAIDPIELPLPIIEPSYFGGDPADVDDIVYEKVQVFAHYKKCNEYRGSDLQACSQQDIQQRIFKNFKTTSELKAIGSRQGALMSFLIDKEGNISEIKAEQSTSKAMTKAAIEAIENLPKLDFPANQQGRDVALRVRVPIVLNFK